MPVRKLDLHGVQHEEVEDLVHRFVNSHWAPNEELHIITGHSPKMKAIVLAALRGYDLERLPHNPANPGYIRVATWQE
jgi:hypothetical protein